MSVESPFVYVDGTRSLFRSLADLDDSEHADLWRTAREVHALVLRHYGAAGANVAVQDGACAGQSVPHVHVHVMPRTKGDGGRCAGMAAFPDAPPIGSVEPDFAALGALSEKLQAA